MKPGNTIDMQMDLMRWWKSNEGLVYAQNFSASVMSRREEEFFASPELRHEAQKMGARIQDMESTFLYKAQPFWISRQFVDLAWKASESLEPQKLFPEDLPVQDGFMYLERPVAMRDAFDREYYTQAIRWSGAVIGDLGEFYPDRTKNDGLSIGIYSPTKGHVDTDVQDLINRGHKMPPMLLFGMQPWNFGQDYNNRDDFKWENRFDLTEVEKERSYEETMRTFQFIQTLWTLMQQTIAYSTTVQPDRATRKRIKKSGLLDDSIDIVRVITLRRIMEHPQEYEGEGNGDVNWSHQWPVRGHWRWQWYRTPSDPNRRCKHCGDSGGEHRQIWIDPYIKGPPDKPFIDKIDVFKLTR